MMMELSQYGYIIPLRQKGRLNMRFNQYGQPYTRYIPNVERYLDGVAYTDNEEYLTAINSRICELKRLVAEVEGEDNSNVLSWNDPIKA